MSPANDNDGLIPEEYAFVDWSYAPSGRVRNVTVLDIRDVENGDAELPEGPPLPGFGCAASNFNHLILAGFDTEAELEVALAEFAKIEGADWASSLWLGVERSRMEAPF